MSVSGTSAGDFPTINLGQMSNRFRWRAGNLLNRAAAGQFIRSFHSPIDRLRPVEVQNQVALATNDDDASAMAPPPMWTQDVMEWLHEVEFLNWGFNPPMLKTYQEDAEYQNIPQTIEFYFDQQDADMDQAYIQPFVAPVVNPFDAEFNPAQQRAFDFNEEDLEKYNWGWQPPTIAVARDEVLYEQAPQQLTYAQPPYLETDTDLVQSSFFTLETFVEPQEIPIPQQWSIVPEIETEQFDWGFNPPLAGGGGTQLMGFKGFWSLKGGMGSWDDWSFNPTVVATVVNPFDQDEGIWYGQMMDTHEEDFGMPVPVISELDTVQVPLTWPWSWHEEDFGWMPPMTKVGFDQDELFPVVLGLRFQEDDVFGFQTPTVTVFTAFAEDDQIPKQERIYAEDETFGFQVEFVSTIDEFSPVVSSGYFEIAETVLPTVFAFDGDISDQVGKALWYQEEESFGFQFAIGFDDARGEIPIKAFAAPADEEERFGFLFFQQPFSYGEEIDHLPWPLYPVTYQLELDQAGLLPIVVTLLIPKIWNFQAVASVVMASFVVRAYQQLYIAVAESSIVFQSLVVRPQVQIADLTSEPQVQFTSIQVRA